MDPRGKDCSPVITITRLKNIIDQLGLTVKERYIDSKVGVHTICLELFCEGTKVGFSNGKGMTIEYALASAYAECIERISSYHTLHMCKYRKYPKESLEKFEFFLYPDSIDMSIEDFCRQDNRLINHYLSYYDSTETAIKDMMVNNICNMGKIRVVPYESVITNKERTVYLPEVATQSVYGSTGLCAGNNYEEAVCQGVFEIMERYCKQEVSRRKLTPPNIPDEYLKQIPDVWESICKIRSIPNKDIYIKDCSLGEGFPVVASVLIDKKDHSYFICFGSSLLRNISIERALTELLQGYDINNYNRLHYICRFDADINSHIVKNFVNGMGEVPIEFFCGEPSYPFNDNLFVDAKDNISLYKYMIDFLNNKGYTLYVRDNSFLGFNSYLTIVPEIMPTLDFVNDKVLQLSDYDAILAEYHMRIEHMNIEEISEYLRVIDNYYRASGQLPCFNMFTKHYEFEESLLWKYQDIRMLLGLFYDCIGVYDEAFLFTNDFIIANRHNFDAELTEDLCFVRDYLNIKAMGILDINDIRKRLNVLYSDDFIDRFNAAFVNFKGLIKYFYGESYGRDDRLIKASTKFFDNVRGVMQKNYSESKSI